MTKTNKWRTYARRLAIACCAAIAVFCIVAWFVGGQLVSPANRRVGPPPDDLPVVATTIASKSGSRIAMWTIPAENSQATLILLHPIRGDRRSMLQRARLFHDAGYSVVMIDLQAHGESPGEHITVGFLESHDVHAAVEYVKAANPNHRIGIVGISMGGAAALLAGPLDIDALVLESVYPTISEAIDNRLAMRLGPLGKAVTPCLLIQLPLRLGISSADLRPVDRIADLDCPVLVACGDRDRRTTFAESQRLFDTARQPKQFVVFVGAGHVDLLSYDSAQYTEEILGFLRKHL